MAGYGGYWPEPPGYTYAAPNDYGRNDHYERSQRDYERSQRDYERSQRDYERSQRGYERSQRGYEQQAHSVYQPPLYQTPRPRDPGYQDYPPPYERYPHQDGSQRTYAQVVHQGHSSYAVPPPSPPPRYAYNDGYHRQASPPPRMYTPREPLPRSLPPPQPVPTRQEQEQTRKEKRARIRRRWIKEYKLALEDAWADDARCVGFNEEDSDFLYRDPTSWNVVLDLERQYASILDRKSKTSSQTQEQGTRYGQSEERKQYEEEETEVRRIAPWSERCVNLTSREKHSMLPA